MELGAKTVGDCVDDDLALLDPKAMHSGGGRIAAWCGRGAAVRGGEKERESKVVRMFMRAISQRESYLQIRDGQTDRRSLSVDLIRAQGWGGS